MPTSLAWRFRQRDGNNVLIIASIDLSYPGRRLGGVSWKALCIRRWVVHRGVRVLRLGRKGCGRDVNSVVRGVVCGHWGYKGRVRSRMCKLGMRKWAGSFLVFVWVGNVLCICFSPNPTIQTFGDEYDRGQQISNHS